MPDHGSSYWPVDEASGTTAFDEVGSHNGQYIQTTYNEYSPPYNPTTPAPIEYQVDAPSLSGLGIGFNRVSNGRPGWTNPYNWSGMRVNTVAGGWGQMYERQEFTISAKIKWYGPNLGNGNLIQCVPGSSGFALGIVTTTDIYGYSLEHPHVLRFTRWIGSASSSITGDIDMPASVGYNTWDDWDDGIYTEPIKIPEWLHFVIRYDGSYKSIWMNGEKIVEDTAPDTLNMQLQAAPIYFNNSQTADWAEIALWHTALPDEEIEG